MAVAVPPLEALADPAPHPDTRASHLLDLLARSIEPARILTRPVDRIAFASDASFYRLIPQAVVLSRGIEEIQALFEISHRLRIPLTFRAGGTSLCGQSITDGILVEAARHWRAVRVEAGGRKVRVQPGIIGAQVNAALKPFHAKMGPDPASIGACTVGGILCNNSSGMCCGVAQNAYHTLDSVTFVLPSGTAIDTAAPRADQMFREREPALAQGLLELKREIERQPALRERIRAKYRTKNTTGYSLNALIDFERPVDIMRHLLVGSEGTLAFIAEAVLNTVPDLPVKYTGLLLFPDLYAACASIVPLREAGAAALELMDRRSLRSIEDQPGMPSNIKGLPEGAAAILAEFQCAGGDDRAGLEEAARNACAGLTLVEPARFTYDPAEQAALWKIRAGLFPSVGAVRKSGTTVIIEDVAFPVERLAGATIELTRLFVRHGYDNGIVFGHAKDGNLHFVVTQSFNDQTAIDRYARFMDDLVELVVRRYDGALKAEHGTGRNMAPFVETEWGAEAYAIMRRLKTLADPENLLNPGVIINADRQAHLRALKALPSVEEEVDRCIECGFCEPKCPSRELTTTPRQRIVLRREIARLRESGEDGERLASLERDFPYMVLDTCAADGLCATGCPVSIDTGQLTKRFRKLRHTAAEHSRASWAARHFGLLERAARAGLRLGRLAEKALGEDAMRYLSRDIAGMAWSSDIPHAASGRLPATPAEGAQAVYFPSCVSRVMGRLPGEATDRSLMDVVVTLAVRAGVPVYVPSDAAGTCCGVPFSSKGYDEAHRIAVNRTIEEFWKWSDEGRLPVFLDTSPCSQGLLASRPYLSGTNQERFDRMRILDSVAFVHDRLLPHLKAGRRVSAVALHPVCSVTKMGLTGKLEAIARACAEKVVTPASAGCCGFAGDRGFLFPELTESATRQEAAEVSRGNFDGHYSSSRTCEIGMTRATGSVYRSYLYLLEQATRR
jgi:D-lactate dehydrogenase